MINDVQIFFSAGEGNSFPLELLHGQGYIIEEVKGLKLRISPESFFQINTAASEILFDSAKNLASINLQTTVLDVCCGSGTIGLSLAKVFNFFFYISYRMFAELSLIFLNF